MYGFILEKLFANALQINTFDVARFQEMLNNQLLDIGQCLTYHDFVGVGRIDSYWPENICLCFTTKSAFGCLMAGNKWLSATPDKPGLVGWDAALERIETWARLIDLKTGDTFW